MVELGGICLVVYARTHVRRSGDFPELRLPGVSRDVDGHYCMSIKVKFKTVSIIIIYINKFINLLTKK